MKTTEITRILALATLLIGLSFGNTWAQTTPPDTTTTETEEEYYEEEYEEGEEYYEEGEEYVEGEEMEAEQDTVPGTVKGILKKGAKDLGNEGKEALNDLTGNMVDEAGKLMDKGAAKIMEGIMKKITGENGNTSSSGSQSQDTYS
ncbi:MAG: hypothetical protein AAFR61_30865, partial [Bacteroidota bacterium]